MVAAYVIDVFTHSADFYPSPVLYPITLRGFDGLALNTPWFLVTNYVALLLAHACYFASAESKLFMRAGCHILLRRRRKVLVMTEP